MLDMIARRKAEADRFELEKDFLQACALLALAGGKWREAATQAKALNLSPRVVGALEKTVTPAATTTGSGTTAFGTLAGAFMQSLKAVGALDAILPFAFQVPVRLGRVTVFSSVASGAVTEGAGKPVRATSLTAVDVPTEQKIVSMVAATKEFLDGLLDSGVRAFGNQLRRAVALGSDAALLTALSGNSSEAMGQPTFQGFLDDLQDALRQIVISPSSRVFAIVTMDMLKGIAVQALASGVTTLGVNGGELAGVTVVGSDAQTAGRLTVLEPSGIAIGATPIDIRSADQATIELNDATTQSSGSPTATSMTSLWQTNSVAILCERRLAIKPIRPSSYAHLTNVALPPTDSPGAAQGSAKTNLIRASKIGRAHV